MKSKSTPYPTAKTESPDLECQQLVAAYESAPRRAAAEQIARTRLGIPSTDLIETAKMIGMSRDKFYASVGLPKSTIEKNIGQQSRLSPAHGDRIYRVNRVFARAVEVLGDESGAKLWIQRNNRSLGGVSPLSLLDTEVGYELVLDTLGRIEYGIVA
jgi:putative toxin-antitoxin system antitoxin component (TIGR02293 family)